MTIREVGIYGHGLALQVSAALLHCHLRDSGIKIHTFNTHVSQPITLCEWDDTLLKVCQQLNRSPFEWLSQCDGGFSWGAQCDWLADDGFIGPALWGLNANQQEFEHGVLRLKAQQPARPVSDFSIAGQAARLGHFNFASRQQQQWAESMKFTVLCDAGKLCELLTHYNNSHGVIQHNVAENNINNLRQHAAAKAIDFWLHLSDSSSMPHEITDATNSASPPKPVTELSIQAGELEKRAWLGQREYRYRLNSKQMNTLLANWHRDTLSIDLPAITAIVPPTTFLVASIEQLLEQWPAHGDSPANAAAYNAHMKRYVEELDAFNQALIPGNPPTMQERLFADCARLPAMETDAVSRWQWFCLLCGKGIVPAATSIALANDADSTILPLVEKVTTHISKTAKAMPAYREFLRQFAIAG